MWIPGPVVFMLIIRVAMAPAARYQSVTADCVRGRPCITGSFLPIDLESHKASWNQNPCLPRLQLCR